MDIFSMSFWADSLVPQKHSWLIIPSGRTAWVSYSMLFISVSSIAEMCVMLNLQGLDWHGPSSDDIWGSLDALTSILDDKHHLRPWRLAPNTRAVVMGAHAHISFHRFALIQSLCRALQRRSRNLVERCPTAGPCTCWYATPRASS